MRSRSAALLVLSLVIALSAALAALAAGCGGRNGSAAGRASSEPRGSGSPVVQAMAAGKDVFGAPVALAAATPIAKLNASPKTFLDKRVRIEGTVAAVCKGRGCWVEVKEKEGVTLIARSLEHDVTVPKDCEGRPIIVEGRFIAFTPPAEAAADAAAHEHGEEHAEGEKPHACPTPTYLVTMEAVELGRAPAE